MALCLGQQASAVRYEDGEYVLEFPDREPLRGDKQLAVDSQMNVGVGRWAIGDVTGIWPLTYVGKY
ncbi:MAG: hypothetical protein M3325_05615 [Actinomycetota bacterium]|nr:hypothetical protein [Actinomycetota bacterium]